MSKLSKKIFSVQLVTIFFCQYFIPINSLRCAHECELDRVPFGTPDPFKIPCKTIDTNDSTSVCSVFLNVDYEDGRISAALNIKHSMTASSTLHIKSHLYPNIITTFINYQCLTVDDCDQEFVRETIGSEKWYDLNDKKLRYNLNSLLYNSDKPSEKIICDNHLECEWFEHCTAELIQNNTLTQHEQSIFNNEFPCDDFDAELVYDQYFFKTVNYSFAILKVYCNKNGCNDESIVHEAHGILQRDFILPLNYSQYIPFTNGSYELKISLFLFLFLFIHSSFFNVLNI